VPSLFNWVTQVGFEIEGVALIVFAASRPTRSSRPGSTRCSRTSWCSSSCGWPRGARSIYLTDSWLRRDRYDPASLLPGRGGLYYRRGGIGWPALIAQAAGLAAAALWLNAYPPFVGPLASRFGGAFGSDFSVFCGLIAGGGVYWLLAGAALRAEGQAAPDVVS